MKNKIIKSIIVLFLSLYSVSCDKDVSVTPPETPVPAGSFSIDSNPKGAEIFVNNKTTGRVTPDSLTFLAKGKYDIRLKLPLYRDSLFSINLGEEEKTSLFVDFNRSPAMMGKLYCSTDPRNAEVYLNGKLTNSRTPVTFTDLLPGTYTVGFKAYGCRDDSEKVVVKSGLQSNISIALKDTTIWVTYDMSNSGLPSNNLTCCAVDGRGVLWIGTASNGLVSFDGTNWKTYTPSNSNLPSSTITSLAVPNYDMYPYLGQTIYIGTGNGLAIYSGGAITQYKKENSPLPDNRVKSVSIDGGNYVWIGTEGGLAIYLPNDNKWETYTTANSPLPENIITSLSAMPGLERHHEAWIGTAHSGVTYFDYVGKKWSLVKSTPGGAMSSVAFSNYTGLWFAWAGTTHSSSGIMNYNNNIFTNFTLGTPVNTIESIVPRPDATWVASSEGLYVKPTGGIWDRLTPDNSKLPTSSIKGIAFDAHGNAWIITYNKGVVKYKLKR